MKKCRFCAEDIQDAAIVCKHCHRPQGDGMLTAPVPGKVAGRITPVGYLGIALGVVLFFVGFAALSPGRPPEGPMFISLIGGGIVAMCYFWVRR